MVCRKIWRPIDQVHTNDKPSDCDWSRAPLGNKGCSYKAVVYAYNAAGYLVAGDKYVQGWAPQATADPKVKTVRVEWTKVAE